MASAPKPGVTKPAALLALLAVSMLVACGGREESAAGGGDADMVLVGATVRTVDPDNPVAEAVAIDGDRISAVGSEGEVLASAGPDTEVIDLDGGAIVPGFVDSHVHAIEAGRFERLCSLSSHGGVRTVVRRLRRCAREQSGQRWVRGSGPLVQDLLALRLDPRELLDRAIPNRPVLINDALGHAAFANSRALREAGIRDGDPDPRGGAFLRTGGRLNGVLLENAQNIVIDAAEPPTKRALRQNFRALRFALREFAAEGITSVSDAGGYWPRGHVEPWRRAERRGVLTVRANNALWVYPNRPFRRQVKAIRALRSDEPGSLLRFNQVKIYVDGIVDYGTAALDRPYSRRPAWSIGGRRGFTYFSRRRLDRYTAVFDRLGFQIHFHVWGDRAAHIALDAIERAQAKNGSAGGPPDRLTHMYLVDDSDLGRFKELGVTADMQVGVEAISPEYARSLRPVIGRADSRRLLPIRSLLDSGANVALSSDWDADELGPLKTMERALTRRASPEVVPDAKTALRMVTLNGAKLLDEDQITGSIKVGKKADLAVLDADPLAVEPSEIGEIDVLKTLLGGTEVYRAARTP